MELGRVPLPRSPFPGRPRHRFPRGQQFQMWPTATPSCILPRTRERTSCAARLPLPAGGERAGEGLGGARVHGNRLHRFVEPSRRLGHRSASAAQTRGCQPKTLPWAPSVPRRAPAVHWVPCPRSMAGGGDARSGDCRTTDSWLSRFGIAADQCAPCGLGPHFRVSSH